jgi:hypothetical protein
MLHAPEDVYSPTQGNLYYHVGSFLAIPEFFCRFPISNGSHHVRTFPIPTLHTGKNPVLIDGRDPGLSHAKKKAVGGSKNYSLTAEGIIRRNESHIPPEC